MNDEPGSRLSCGQAALGTRSRTSAMADTFRAYEEDVAEFREKLQYVDGACGLAVAIGGRVVAAG